MCPASFTAERFVCRTVRAVSHEEQGYVGTIRMNLFIKVEQPSAALGIEQPSNRQQDGTWIAAPSSGMFCRLPDRNDFIVNPFDLDRHRSGQNRLARRAIMPERIPRFTGRSDAGISSADQCPAQEPADCRRLRAIAQGELSPLYVSFAKERAVGEGGQMRGSESSAQNDVRVEPAQSPDDPIVQMKRHLRPLRTDMPPW